MIPAKSKVNWATCVCLKMKKNIVEQYIVSLCLSALFSFVYAFCFRAPKEPESLDDILGLEIKDREIQRKKKPYSTFSRRPDEDGEIPVSCHQRKKRKHLSTGDMFVIVRYFNLS